jgi:hypothetical protein
LTPAAGDDSIAAVARCCMTIIDNEAGLRAVFGHAEGLSIQ